MRGYLPFQSTPPKRSPMSRARLWTPRTSTKPRSKTLTRRTLPPLVVISGRVPRLVRFRRLLQPRPNQASLLHPSLARHAIARFLSMMMKMTISLQALSGVAHRPMTPRPPRRRRRTNAQRPPTTLLGRFLSHLYGSRQSLRPLRRTTQAESLLVHLLRRS